MLTPETSGAVELQTVEQEGGDLSGFVDPFFSCPQGAYASQRPQQGGAGDVAVHRACRTSGIEETGEGVGHAAAGAVEDW
ncbi:hypothetical protein ACE1SV_62710 [Streptomyces sennicomposti]